MSRFFYLFAFLLILTSFITAQKTIKPRPRSTPVKAVAKNSVDRGTVVGKTFTNKTFGFHVTLPDTWLIPGDDFEASMKKQGFDLALKAPDSLPAASKSKVDQAVDRVEILLTAYRSMPGMSDNAIVRISVEDLVLNPQIGDAVDYFDAIRAMFASMKLPADFKYSETQAEKLGAMQFAYLDTSTAAGNKRMYATVRNGYAIMFTLTYTKDEDLQTLRDILSKGNFSLR